MPGSLNFIILCGCMQTGSRCLDCYSCLRVRERIERVADGTKPLSMKKNMAWNTVGSFTNLVAQWLITVIVVRISSGFDAAGLYSLAVSVYGIFAPIAQYRMYTYQISDTQHENSVGEYFTLRIITNAMALVGCFGYAAFTCPLSALPAILLFGLYKSLILLLDVFHACEQRHCRLDYVGISLILQGIISLALFTIAFLLSDSLELTLAIMCLGIMGVGVFYDFSRAEQFEKLRIGITFAKTKRLLLRCLPFVAGALACAAASSVPRQFLFSEVGEAALGIYSSVAAPVAVIQNGASYMYYPLIGYFADYYAAGEKKKLLKLFARVTVGIAGVGVVSAILLELFGGPILELFFGNGISEYTYLLTPMIISALVSAYMWFLNDLLIAVRDFSGNFFGNIASLAAALLVMTPFIRWWGMNGVSFTAIAASFAGVLVMALSFLVKLRKHLKRPDITGA